MYTRRDVLRLATASAGSILVASLADLPVRADAPVWPPPATNPADDPYGTGTFHSNGVTYTISYIDVVNAAVLPNDPSVQAGPASATVTGSQGGTYTYDSSLYTSDNWTGTDMGSQSKLWRIGSVIAKAIVAPKDVPGSDQSTGTGSMFFRYQITASNPPSNSMDVTIRIANGVSNVEAQAYVSAVNDPPGSESYSLTGSATSTGYYPGGSLTATASAEYDSVAHVFPHDPDTKYSGPVRAVDFFAQSHMLNGVGYILVGVTLHSPSGQVSAGDFPPSTLPATGYAQGSSEIVPLQVVAR